MNGKSFSCSSHQHSDPANLSSAAYVNQIFTIFVVGISVFLGVAWMLEIATTSAPKPTSLSSSIQL